MLKMTMELSGLEEAASSAAVAVAVDDDVGDVVGVVERGDEERWGR